MVAVVVPAVQAEADAASAPAAPGLLRVGVGEAQFVGGALLLHVACSLRLADVGRGSGRDLVLGIGVEVIVAAGRMLVGLGSVVGDLGAELQAVFALGRLAPGPFELEVELDVLPPVVACLFGVGARVPRGQVVDAVRFGLFALLLAAVEHVAAHGEGGVLVAQAVALVVVEVEADAPRGVQAVAAPSAVAVAAHRRVAHHLFAHVAEARVVGVVGVGDQRMLAVAVEVAQHALGLETVVDARTVAPGARRVAEVAASHLGFELQVDHLLPLAVVDARQAALLGLHVHHLHRFEHVGGEVAGGGLDVRTEELLAIHIDLRHRFALGGDAAVGIHFDARQAFQQVLSRGIGFQLVAAGIVFDGVFADDHGGRGGRDHRFAQQAVFLLHIDVAQRERFLPMMQREGLVCLLESHVGELHEHALVGLAFAEQTVQSGAVEREVAVAVGEGAHDERRVGEGQQADGGARQGRIVGSRSHAPRDGERIGRRTTAPSDEDEADEGECVVHSTCRS